jgi:hypothetical protein
VGHVVVAFFPFPIFAAFLVVEIQLLRRVDDERGNQLEGLAVAFRRPNRLRGWRCRGQTINAIETGARSPLHREAVREVDRESVRAGEFVICDLGHEESGNGSRSFAALRMTGKRSEGMTGLPDRICDL